MGAADGAFERTRLASERIARLKRDLDRAERIPGPHGVGAVPGCGQLMAAKLGELVSRGWFLLHDVHWPGRPLARLDHVLVGPGGVIVIGAKSWTGHVEVTEGVLRHNGYAQHPAVEVALGQAAAVAALLPPSRRRFVRSLICIAGQAGLSGTTASGIEMHGIDSVVAAVAGMPDALDSPAVVELYAQLGRLLTQPQVPDATGLGGQPGRIALAKNARGRPEVSGTAARRASTTQPPAVGPSAAAPSSGLTGSQSATAPSETAPSATAHPAAAQRSAPRHATVRKSGFRHATVLPSSVLPSRVPPSAVRPALPPPHGSRGRYSPRQSSLGRYSLPRNSNGLYVVDMYSAGLYPAGREYPHRPALRSAGMAMIAGLISTALLAPPLWLLWELLPK